MDRSDASEARLEHHLEMVSRIVREMNLLARSALAGPGYAGLIEDFLDISNVPKNILEAYEAGNKASWQNGWSLE